MNTAVLWIQSLQPWQAIGVGVGVLCAFIALCISALFSIGIGFFIASADRKRGHDQARQDMEKMLSKAERETQQRPRVRAISK